MEEKGAIALRGRSRKTKDAAAVAAAAGKGAAAAAAAGGKRRLRVAAADAAATAAAAGDDPFAKARRDRGLQIAKQKLRELRNAAEAQTDRKTARGALRASGGGPQVLPPGIPVLGSQQKHRNKSKEELREIMERSVL